MTVIADRYELGEVIGTGGMSDVYAATDTLLGRGVAVKVLRLDLARDATFRERFRKEAQNSGSLNHPAIVAVYDTGETTIDGVAVPFIVMERVFGSTLREVLNEDGPMSAADAAELLIPVCDALEISHHAGIIHRDIKPANIMLTNTGSVKVMDFGIARALGDTTSAMTQTAAVIGTAQYLSPEQARGKTVDARSDVYALGCLLYEMLTGTPPFQGDTAFAVAYQHVQEDPEPPSSHIPGLTPTEAVNIDAVVLTAMAKHPADRYQSAAEMGEDLDRLARNAVTSAARSHVTSAGGHTAGVAGAVATTAFPAAGAAGAADAAGAPTEIVPAAGAHGAAGSGAQPNGSHRKPANRTPRIIAAVLGAILLIVGGAFAVDYMWDRITSESRQSVVLPDVAGLTRTEAVAQLEELGLRVEVTEEPSPDVPRETVLRTNPSAGSTLQQNTAVTVTVSSGRELTDVPSLQGMTLDEATEALDEAGLILATEVKQEASDTVEEGSVTTQDPAAGSQISMGSAVTVTVSSGPEMVTVPDLTGMDSAQAQSVLTSLGLTVTVTQVDSTEAQGRVVSVANAGSEVEAGSTVRLEVSNGSAMVMPDVTGMTREAALAALKAAGWQGSDSDLATGSTVATANLAERGTVAASSPAAGSQISNTQRITLQYYEFNLNALVP